MRTLDHPNIVRYLGADRDGATVVIFMEFVPNGSLATLVRQYGPVRNERVARRYAIDVLSGL